MFINLTPVIPIFATVFTFLIARRARLSIFMGCVVASLLLAKWSPWQSIIIFVQTFLQKNELVLLTSPQAIMTASTLCVYLFIVLLNIYISLIHKSGIAYGYYNFLSEKLKSKRSAELSSLFLGILLFIDDYLSVMTNIKVSSLFCSRFKIPKLKVCFLATCMAAPLCTLVPISSWGAAIAPTIANSLGGTVLQNWDSFIVLTGTVPYIFFSILIIISSFLITIKQYSFGLMKQEEDQLLTKHMNAPQIPDHIWKFKAWHFIMPIFTMIGLIIFFMLLFGNYFSSSGHITIFQALKNNSGLDKPLLLGVLVNLIIMFTIFLSTRILTVRHALESIYEGISGSGYILLLLALSATFSELIRLLGIGKTLCALAILFINPVFLPATIFLITSILGIVLGSAWTTMILLIPAILPMVQNFSTFIGNTQQLQQLMMVSIGAIISGAVFGTGISPISDLLNLATKCGKVPPGDYLKIQLQYNIPVGLSALISFVISGFLIHKSFFYCWSISILAGLIILVALLELGTRLDKSYSDQA